MSYQEKISLKDAIEFIVDNRGKTVPTSNIGIALIATNCINNSSLYPEFKNVRYISEETYKNWFRAHPKPDDIIFTLKGSQNGAACLVPQKVNFAIAQDMVALRANKKIMDPYFLLAALRSKEVQYSIKSLDVSDVIPHLKKGDFDKLLLPKPSLEIQKTIGQIFITLERKIELNRQMNQTLEAMAQALFKSWFVDFDPVMDNAIQAGNNIPDELLAMAEKRSLVPENQKLLSKNPELAALFPFSFVFNETLGKWIPEGWEVKSLYECAEFVNGASFKSDNFTTKENGKPIIKIVELKSGLTDQTKYTNQSMPKKYLVSKGDLLYSWSGSPDTSLSAFLWTGDDGWLNQHVFNVVTKNENHKSFCYYLLNHLKPILIAIAKDKQTTGLGHITVKDMKNIYVVQPLKNFDNLILGSSSKLFRRIFEIELENKTLVQLRDRLLPELISGKVRVKEKILNNL